MSRTRFAVALVAAFVSATAFAADEPSGKNQYVFPMGAVSFGLSYPLIASASAGAFLPLGRQDPNNSFPSVPSLRVDAQLGLGGGSTDAGIYLPLAEGSFAVNLKASRLRTWLIEWNQPRGRTYEGGVAELVILGHIPGKIGLGYYREREAAADGRNAFTYFFVGVGW